MFRAKDIQVTWMRPSSRAKPDEDEKEENDATQKFSSFIFILSIVILS